MTDASTIRDRLTEALKANTADYCEIRYETEDSIFLSFRGAEAENTIVNCFGGGIVRACTKGAWGVAVFDSLDGLGDKVQKACSHAGFAGRESTELAETAIVDEVRTVSMKHDFRGVPLDDKVKMIESYNQALLACDDAIESSLAYYGDAFRMVYFLNSRGAWFAEERPRLRSGVAATARNGNLVQTSHDSVASPDDFGVALRFEEQVENVAELAVALLAAPKCKGGPQTVVLDQDLGGVFIHEAFGHLSESDFLYENPKLREQMVIGRKLGVPELNAYDSGTYQLTTGSLSFDDEGTASSCTQLIKEGVLNAHLNSRETAAKMGEAPTGNARAVSRSHTPIVRMTNTYIDNGSLSKDELFAGVDDGVYACHAFGGQTMMEMFTFSAAYGYRIENGQVGELLRDVVLTGNVFTTLNSIDGLADDLEMSDTAGGCGKGGQSPLPVGFGAPHMRIRNVVIGGEQ